MTFKTRLHTYSFGLAPTGRARCRGCRRLIERGALRLVIHAFVRPNRGTRFMRHLGCVGSALQADIARAHGDVTCVPREGALTAEMVGQAWAAVGSERVVARGDVERQVGTPNQPVLRSHGYVFGESTNH